MVAAALKDKLPEMIRVLKNHQVVKAYAFGSVCIKSFTNTSDIDILVGFNSEEPFKVYAENFWSLEVELNSILQREIDLLPTHSLKNKFFIQEIEETKVPLYE
jgi:predicted nucleotidyltransferase